MKLNVIILASCLLFLPVNGNSISKQSLKIWVTSEQVAKLNEFIKHKE
jgi:hypothetical protein